jgi:hypothetical protein
MFMPIPDLGLAWQRVPAILKDKKQLSNVILDLILSITPCLDNSLAACLPA